MYIYSLVRLAIKHYLFHTAKTMQKGCHENKELPGLAEKITKVENPTMTA